MLDEDLCNEDDLGNDDDALGDDDDLGNDEEEEDGKRMKRWLSDTS